MLTGVSTIFQIMQVVYDLCTVYDQTPV